MEMKEMENGNGNGKRKRKWKAETEMVVKPAYECNTDDNSPNHHKESERVKHAALSTASPNSCNEINSC